MRKFISDCFKLSRPYFQSEERFRAWFLLGIIVALSLGEVYILVLLNHWNNDFYNSLQAVDKAAFVKALIRFSYLAGFFIVIAVYKTYLNQMMQIKWRRWMTAHYLTKWLANQHHYLVENKVGSETPDNPDQRISEDIAQFISTALGLSLGLLSACVTLFSFLGILWQLSGVLEIPGLNLKIPGYMVWIALVYAMAGTWITFLIGKPLVQLNFNQQRFEADFRFSLVRLRENSESIAFYKGEAQEQQNFLNRFSFVVGNFWQIMKRQKILNWFGSGYAQIAIIFPFVVASPRFFAGKIQLGGLMQTASAFGRVQDSLSYIIESFTSIAALKAVSQRLIGFNESIAAAEAAQIQTAEFRRYAPAKIIRATDLAIKLPTGEVLLSNLNLTIKPASTLLIIGPSGVGKSTLLRTLAGLWPYASGQLVLPAATNIMFLPQKPYLPLADLKSVFCYPDKPTEEEKILEVLKLVKLEHLADRLDETARWSHTLSLGEQQRIAFARVLLSKPEFVFMDEATSALDENSEAELYKMLLVQLPGAAVISVGHRSTLKQWHEDSIDLENL